jgi:hypothetical protein
MEFKVINQPFIQFMPIIFIQLLMKTKRLAALVILWPKMTATYRVSRLV